MQSAQRPASDKATYTSTQQQFVPATDHADVCAVIVTYNSSGQIGELLASLRDRQRRVSLRVVVADNGSSDDTLGILSGHPDVVVLPTGGNLGYSAGINAALGMAGSHSAVLILNPDLKVDPGAVDTMFATLQNSGAGIVVPKLLDGAGRLYPSLRTEPGLCAAAGDALFGEKLPGRPGVFSEIVFDPSAYTSTHEIEWATGAALMIESQLVQDLGPWDERFFLYSEETDYFRRARDRGAVILYTPDAVMRHLGGASGSSPRQEALMAVNRIRYMRKHAGTGYARAYAGLVKLREVLRCYKPTQREICHYLLDEARWHLLPGPTDGGNPDAVLEGFPRGSIIIPAHNESAVINRTLCSLKPVMETGRVEVIVACNGCTDDTAQIAERFEAVHVLQVAEASKVAALNAADAVAKNWPRLYLDADIVLTPGAVRRVFEELARGPLLAARPAMRYDDSRASWPVRSFYRARRRIPGTDQSLWGAGAYALTEAGHSRFGQFPALTGDDRYVDAQFAPWEKTVIPTSPVTVVTPAKASWLLSILKRNYRGDEEVAALAAAGTIDIHRSGGSSTRRTVKQLCLSVVGPRSLADALIYAGFVTTARLLQRNSRSSRQWERDESSRRRNSTINSY